MPAKITAAASNTAGQIDVPGVNTHTRNPRARRVATLVPMPGASAFSSHTRQRAEVPPEPAPAPEIPPEPAPGPEIPPEPKLPDPGPDPSPPTPTPDPSPLPPDSDPLTI